MYKIKYFFYLTCFLLIFSCNKNGEKLSPINLTESSKNDSLKPLYADYAISNKFQVANNGKFLRIAVVNNVLIVPQENSYLGKELNLSEIQIKSPSEHTINGKSFPLELQFIHTDTTQNTTIVSVMVVAGAKNTSLKAIINNIPDKDFVNTINEELDVYMLFPQKPGYWKYKGSTTYKPYKKNITWYIMKKNIAASADQINKITDAIGTNKVDIVEPSKNLKIDEL